MKNKSPLRYPGGKSKLTDLIKIILKDNQITNGTYIEGFAGGSGIAINLLFDGTVNEIVINDYDKAVYSFWRAVKEDSSKLIELIRTTPITVEEWRKQKSIYVNNNKKYSVELAFAFLFLNRTNRSGILSAGPIGGFDQNGNYPIDARFNKIEIINKIQAISKYKDKIHVYNKDIFSFIKQYVPKYLENSFIYFDPPYFNKGKELYKNFFTIKDHKKLSLQIKNDVVIPWFITYDDTFEIKQLYNEYDIALFDLNYGTSNRRAATEIAIIYNNDLSFIEDFKKFNFRKAN